jgi:hypothetical protein
MNKRPILFGMYPVAFAVMSVPFVDLITGSFPPHVGNISWRFMVIGQLLKSLLVPMMGLGFATLIAAFLEQRRVVRTLAVVGMVAALLIVACSITFALDYMQLRPTFGEAMKQQADTASVTALLIAGIVIPVAMGIGIGGWKTGKMSHTDRDQMRTEKTKSSVLIRQTPPKESAT